MAAEELDADPGSYADDDAGSNGNSRCLSRIFLDCRRDGLKQTHLGGVVVVDHDLLLEGFDVDVVVAVGTAEVLVFQNLLIFLLTFSLLLIC